jgi:hypothetical protein
MNRTRAESIASRERLVIDRGPSLVVRTLGGSVNIMRHPIEDAGSGREFSKLYWIDMFTVGPAIQAAVT